MKAMKTGCMLSFLKNRSLSEMILHNRDHEKTDKEGKAILPQVIAHTPENFNLIEHPEISKNKTPEDLQELENSRKIYLDDFVKTNTKQKSQVKQHFIDGLIVLGDDVYNNLPKDKQKEVISKVNKFIAKFCTDNGVRLLSSSLHRDEGHDEKSGEHRHNTHLQFCFENVVTEKNTSNLKLGTTVLRTLGAGGLSKLQKGLAKELAQYGFTQNYYKAGKAPKQTYWKKYKSIQIDKERNLSDFKSFEQQKIDDIIAEREMLLNAIKTAFNDPNITTVEQIKAKGKELREELRTLNDKIKDLPDMADYVLKRTDYAEIEKLAKEKTQSLADEVMNYDLDKMHTRYKNNRKAFDSNRISNEEIKKNVNRLSKDLTEYHEHFYDKATISQKEFFKTLRDNIDLLYNNLSLANNKEPIKTDSIIINQNINTNKVR